MSYGYGTTVYCKRTYTIYLLLITGKYLLYKLGGSQCAVRTPVSCLFLMFSFFPSILILILILILTCY